MRVSHLIPLILAIGFCSADARRALDIRSSEEIPIDGTSLRLILPPHWEIAPTKLGLPAHNVLRYKGEPNLELDITQMAKWPEGQWNPLALPFECDFLLSAFRKMPDGRSAVFEQRPSFFPVEFYSRVLVTDSPQQRGVKLVIGCLFLGNSSLVVDLQPYPSPKQWSDLTAMLLAIEHAGKRQSTLLYAPGEIHLPVLSAAVKFSAGSWGVGRQRFAENGDVDLLVRTGGSVETKLLPILWKGQCSGGMNPEVWSRLERLTDRPIVAQARHNPSYVSSKWEPMAYELPFPSETPDRPMISKLMVTACRQLDASTALLVVIGYGSEEISPTDAPSVAIALDEIADAVARGPKGDGGIYVPPFPFPPKPTSDQMRSVIGAPDSSGSAKSTANDLRLQVAADVQTARLLKKVEPVYPPLARQTRVSGVVKLHVLVDTHGKVIELRTISGHPLLIQAALDAVRQWEYEPTVVNGTPALVDTEVDVVFALAP